ncbi:septation protein A [Amorphus orientalis]|uniref:Inner membrane-spanning protein YciB n=1 Tax=Amorphus orientalis TaxID=649198 RepID=A0AAE4ARG6_9HYPH|nr:septation protein A [Amorphus orientalis]MDQ0315161.1 intracellular septation protein [Amorphus orientalis]
MTEAKPINPLLKLALELGPLVIFFVTNARIDLITATGAFMAATVVALAVSYAIQRSLPIMPLVTGVVVLVFGGLTLALQDELFIKLKPTIVNCLFAAVLFGGLAIWKRPLLGLVLDSVISMDDDGWRKLTIRWASFFLFLALLNEIVWRNFSSDFWVSFKVFGIMPITMVFALAQIPLIERHKLPSGEEGESVPGSDP